MIYIVNRWDLEQERKNAAEVFASIDKNGNQMLSREELKEGMIKSGMRISDEEFENLFVELDKDNSGSIGYREYLAHVVDNSILLNDKCLEDAFNFFDVDHDKTISKNNLKSVLNQGSISNTQLSELFNSMDANNDGKVYKFFYFRSL